MIIKRKLKSQMPSLKRCKLGVSANEDDEHAAKRKKRKTNGYYPLNLLGEVAAGILPVSFHGILHGGVAEKAFAASWCTEVSCSPDEVVSKSKGSDSGRLKNRTVEVSRPPLVRTSRGRVQVLPSRFNDSVIENWKKESKTSLRDYGFDDETECKKEKFSFKTAKNCNNNVKSKTKEDRNGYKNRKYGTLCEEEERDEVRFSKSFDIRKYSSSRSSLTSVHEPQLADVDNEKFPAEEIVDLTSEEVFLNGDRKDDGLYGPEDFYSGDIVWAKSGIKDPYWPAIVIDPMTQAPELVLRSCIPDAACVMFFGHCTNENQREYAWVKGGMIFPFVDFMDRFQEQSELSECNPSDFQMALEEAVLADQGFIEKLIHDINVAAGNPTYDDESVRWVQEATGSNQDLDYSIQGVSGKNKDARPCDGCGNSLSFKLTKKMKTSAVGGKFLCKTCARLTKSKHFCGICKKVWNHSDNGSWVRCDGCKVWVHAECDRISSSRFKDLVGTDYYCPACKAKFNFELSDSEKWLPKVKCNKNNSQLVLPNKVSVLCSGVEGIYYPSLHSVVCKCGHCGTEKMALSEWERHTGSKLRNWRTSVKVKGSMLPLEQWTAGSIVEAALKRDPHEIEFIQSVQEAVHALERVIAKNSHYVNIMERLLEPERMVVFRVPWVDDRGETHVNRGFRVQFNQALGPCRGGIRFHPSVNLSIVKFLGFEQTLKNALSPYKLGGAAGGSDFDPKGKSDNEIMRFCQSFMNEIYRYLGPDKDLPSEEMGVGTREMGYLFGQYRRLAGHFQGSFTGPRIFWSGSSLRTEATGYGLVFFAQLILADMNKELKGLRCVVSGSGKIAMHVLEKLIAYGALPVTVSDSKGYLVDEDGFDYMKISFLREIKAQQRSLRDYSKTYARSKYYDEAKPWTERCDVAFPCASQNEIDQSDAINLVNSGCHILVEGSNMPCTPEAVDVLRKANVLMAPAMAAGAGGVVAGELELNHECNLMHWSPEDFESKLQEAMKQTYQRALKAATDFGYQKESPDALVHGAVISSFLTIAQAMTDQGCV